MKIHFNDHLHDVGVLSQQFGEKQMALFYLLSY